MNWMDQLGELKVSALKELANVGISHVATAISEITREAVNITVPEMTPFSKQQLLEMPNQDGEIVGAYLNVDGISEITETLIFFTKKDALNLMNKFINVDSTLGIDTMNLSFADQKSIFSEISTVVAATYFSAAAAMFNLKTRHGVPNVNFENGKLSEFIKGSVHQNEGISINTSFVSEKTNLRGKILLIPDPKTLDIFFRTIGLEV